MMNLERAFQPKPCFRLVLIAFLTLVTASFFISIADVSAKSTQNATTFYLLYVGTYTDTKSKGIYGYRFDTATGQLIPLGLKAEIENPSFVVTDPWHRFLYAVTEIGIDGETSGIVSSFAIDPKNGDLKLLNRVSSGGAGPCHLTVDSTGRILFVANYDGGNVAAFALKEDGSIGKQTGFDQHRGSSINLLRQEGPHAHEVVLSPNDRFLLVPDLGTDAISIYKVDAVNGTFTLNNPASVSVKFGSGPRHIVLGPGGKFAYLVCEMGSNVDVFSFDPAKGSLTFVQTISTLPPGFVEENNSAEIQIDAAGRFLYASNRGHDSIAVFAIDPRRGTLTKIQTVPTQGKTPRNFVIDPTGKYLLAANQDSDQIVVFVVDRRSGELTPTGTLSTVPSPASLVFVPADYSAVD
jgi:6-phosphogluconolactonase